MKHVHPLFAAARASLYRYLDAALLRYVDKHIFLSVVADIEVVGTGCDVWSYGVRRPEHERLMFCDMITLQEIFDLPTGETHRSDRGMAATTYGDVVYKKVSRWCVAWYQDFIAHEIEDCSVIWDTLEKEGVTNLSDYLSTLPETLDELRDRVRTAKCQYT